MSSVLLVDDESMVVDVLQTMLTSYGHEVVSTTEPEEAAGIIAERSFDLYLFDLRMPEPSGAELAETVLGESPEAKVLIMTAYPGDPLAARAMRAGAAALVRKPFEIGKILSFLEEKPEELCNDRS